MKRYEDIVVPMVFTALELLQNSDAPRLADLLEARLEIARATATILIEEQTGITLPPDRA
jgi:hypothetical protein